MANEKNLKSFNNWNKEDHLQISKKGGTNSGKARRKKGADLRKEINRQKAELYAIVEVADELKRIIKKS